MESWNLHSVGSQREGMAQLGDRGGQKDVRLASGLCQGDGRMLPFGEKEGEGRR